MAPIRRAPGPALLLAGACAALALAPTRGGAQEADTVARLRGMVLDAQGDAPVAANVAWVAGGAGQGARTDAEGRFVLRVAPGLPVELRVRALGYRQQSLVLTLRPGQDTTVVLRLASAAVTLATVRTVAVAPERQRFEETPDVGTFTVAGRSLARLPGLGEGDPLRAIATLPGATARNDFMAGINVRGGEADQNLVLLDGIPVYNPFHFGGLFGTFIDEAVERIDLSTAAFPASQGGRLSSVLDVRTVEEARQGLHGAAELSLLASTLALGSAFPDARGSWNVAARRTYADVVAGTLSSHSLPYHFQDGQLRGSVLLPGGGSLSLTAYAGHDALEEPDELAESCEECRGGPFSFTWGNRLAGATWTQPLRGGALLTHRVHYSRFATRYDDEFGQLALHNSLDDAGASGTLAWPWGQGTIAVGWEGARYHVAYRERIAPGIELPWEEGQRGSDTTLRQRATAGAVFADVLWRRGRLLLRPGLRAEGATGAGWMGVSPRLSAKWLVRPNVALTAAVSRHTQLLHAMRNEDLPVRVFDLWVTSTRDVPESRATHLVGGAEAWWRDDAWVLRVEGWRKRFHDLAEPSATLDPRIRIDELRRFDGRSYGLDAYLRRFDRGAVGGWVSYGYAVSRREHDGVRYAPAQDRRHNGNVVLSWRPGSRWSLGGRLAVASGTPFTGSAGWYGRAQFDPVTGTWRPAPQDPVDARGDRNAARYPLYVRLDAGVERAWLPRPTVVVRPYLQLVNVTNRRNVFLYDFDPQGDPPTVEAFTQFPLLPTIGVKVEF